MSGPSVRALDPASAPDAVVVGAGVIGSSIALELARAGRRVVVIDKAGGPGHGSTSASSALVRFNYSTLSGVLTAWESKFCWEEWESHLGFRDPAGLSRFHRTGVLHLDVPVMPREPQLRLLDQCAIPYEELTADELVSRFPFVDNGRHWPNKPVTEEAFWEPSHETLGGYLTPDAGFVDDPQLAAANLAAAAAHYGANFRLHSRVVAAHHTSSKRWLLTLSSGTTIESPIVINAAGPWSTTLNRLAGVGAEFTVDVRPMRQEVHHTSTPTGYNPPGRYGPAITDLDLGVYMRPGPSDSYLVGGTEPECDGFEWLEDPDQADPRVTKSRHESQMFRAARRLPDLGVPGRPLGVAGVYDVASDWTPIYDKTDAPGYFVAMGTSGNQFKNAPLVGKLMAHLVRAVEDGHDHDQDPVTYVGDRTGLSIDLGTFSRRRPVNDQSSGTVMG